MPSSCTLATHSPVSTASASRHRGARMLTGRGWKGGRERRRTLRVQPSGNGGQSGGRGRSPAVKYRATLTQAPIRPAPDLCASAYMQSELRGGRAPFGETAPGQQLLGSGLGGRCAGVGRCMRGSYGRDGEGMMGAIGRGGSEYSSFRRRHRIGGPSCWARQQAGSTSIAHSKVRDECARSGGEA